MRAYYTRQAFTLIELLVVIAIIAILAVIALLILNPAELLRQSRDANRLSVEATLNSAMGLATLNGNSLGTPYTVYISIPDPTLSGSATSTCSALGLPTLPSPWVYQCVSATNIKNINDTGWLPIALNSLPSGAPISSLPTDAINNTSTYLFSAYATDGTKYEITTHDESQKYAPGQWTDGGEYSDLQETGTNPKLIPADLGGGNIYVLSILRGIEDYASNNTLLSQFSSYGSSAGQVSNPGGIATDNIGNLYVADSGNNRVEEFSPNGTYLSQFGSTGSGNGQFNSPHGIAFDPNGNIWIADSGNNRVEEFSSNGTYLSQFGSAGSGNGQFNIPIAIAFDQNGNMWVTDENNNRVEEFSPNGTYLSQFGSSGSGNGQFNSPYGIAFDQNGNMWVTDENNNRVEEFSPNGTYLSQFGSSGSGNGQFFPSGHPYGISISRNGIIYVNNSGAFRTDAFNTSGTYISSFGNGNIPVAVIVQQ